jgi:hypothetical protein
MASIFRLVFVAIASLLAGAVTAPTGLAADDLSLEGQKVTVISWDARFKMGDKVVGQPELGDTYTVEKVKGDWLSVQGHSGYLKGSDVVPYEKAIEYLSKKIKADPSTATFQDRGICRQKRGEFRQLPSAKSKVRERVY